MRSDAVVDCFVPVTGRDDEAKWGELFMIVVALESRVLRCLLAKLKPARRVCQWDLSYENVKMTSEWAGERLSRQDWRRMKQSRESAF